MPSKRNRLWFVLILFVGVGLRFWGLTQPWDGSDWHSALGGFGTGAYAKNYADHGFFESSLMPYRWRIDLADGSVERFWYTHHPALYSVLAGISLKLFGAKTWALFVPSLLFSIASFFACRRLARALDLESESTMAYAFFAVLPMGIFYGILPWAEVPIAWLFMELLAAYVAWWKNEDRRSLTILLACVVLGGLLDWPAHFLLPALCAHLLATSLARSEPRRLRLVLWMFLASTATVGLHWLHYNWIDADTSKTETSNTLSWVFQLTIPVSTWLGFQRDFLLKLFGWPTLVLLATGLLLQLTNLLRGRRAFENGLLLVLLFPALCYVGLFRARSTNHEFFWYLALPYAAFTAGLVCQRAFQIARRRNLGPLVLAGVLAVLAHGTHQGIEIWRKRNPAPLREVVEKPWLREALGDERNVVVAGMGYGMMLHYWADSSLVSDVKRIRDLEELHGRALSRLAPGRPVLFLFDRTTLPFFPDLHAYLEKHGTLLQSDRESVVGLDLFDLTRWAGSELP